MLKLLPQLQVAACRAIHIGEHINSSDDDIRDDVTSILKQLLGEFDERPAEEGNLTVRAGSLVRLTTWRGEHRKEYCPMDMISKACLSEGSCEFPGGEGEYLAGGLLPGQQQCPDRIVAPSNSESIKFENSSTHKLCYTRSFRKL